jgi:calcineurin-like phosphoesterase family protein
MTIFFTADTHFGHGKIISYCNRPYATADEMDADLIRRWNEVVKPDDTVYHLGDLAFRNRESAFHQLNGQKHLIIGNHDGRKVIVLPWASQPVTELFLTIKDAEGIDRELFLYHYPVEEWDGFYRGVIHLHGHVHGKQLHPCEKIRVDVGVDRFNFTPVTIDQILESVKND